MPSVTGTKPTSGYTKVPQTPIVAVILMRACRGRNPYPQVHRCAIQRTPEKPLRKVGKIQLCQYEPRDNFFGRHALAVPACHREEYRSISRIEVPIFCGTPSQYPIHARGRNPLALLRLKTWSVEEVHHCGRLRKPCALGLNLFDLGACHCDAAELCTP